MHDYIAEMYRRGRDAEARRAIAAEITRANTAEDAVPTYTPKKAEIDAVEAEYWASRRQHLYGPIGAQLDEIYHDLDAWNSRLSAVRAQVPKP
jgi:hypothetical protein